MTDELSRNEEFQNRYYIELPDEEVVFPTTRPDDAPLVTLTINSAWRGIVARMVSTLDRFSFDISDEEDLRLAVSDINALLEFKVFCEEVENCLQSSATIATIESDVATAQQTATTAQQTATTANEAISNGVNGTVYEPPPSPQTDPACGASYYIVDELRAYIATIESYPATYANILQAIVQAIQDFGDAVIALLKLVLTGVYDASWVSVLPDYDAQLDLMREHLYCNGFDKSVFSDYVRNNLTRGNEIADFVDSVAFVTWEQWHNVGSLDDSRDCSAFICSSVAQTYIDFADGSQPLPATTGTLTNGWEYNVLLGTGEIDNVLSGSINTNPVFFRSENNASPQIMRLQVIAPSPVSVSRVSIMWAGGLNSSVTQVSNEATLETPSGDFVVTQTGKTKDTLHELEWGLQGSPVTMSAFNIVCRMDRDAGATFRTWIDNILVEFESV